MKKYPKIKIKPRKEKSRDLNREFLLKWLPFNFCDRYCERCEDFRDVCKIYQEDLNFRTRCLIEGKDPNDPKVAFEEVSRTFAETLRMLTEMMKKEDIKFTREDEDRYFTEEDKKRKIINNHPLRKKCSLFSDKLFEFLSKFPIPFTEKKASMEYLNGELDELAFYCRLVSVKTGRALHSKIEEEKDKDDFPRPDSLVSATLGYYSLLTCMRSLKIVAKLIGDLPRQQKWANSILKMAAEVQKEFETAFPEVKNFKSKAIFHGKL